MNSVERVKAVIAGSIPDRVPVCLHNCFMAAREAGIPMAKFRTDPEAIAKTFLVSLEKYGHDCLLLDIDTTMLAEAMGAVGEFSEDEPAKIVKPAIRSLKEVGKLKVVNPETDARIPAFLEATRILAKQVGSEVALRGNADQAAFDLACMVLGISNFLEVLAAEPDNPAIFQLLEICYQSHLAVHRALKKAGATFTSMGDSLCGPDVCSPKTFKKFGRPFEERLVKDLAAEGCFTVIHICGDTRLILDDLAEYDFCGFELDYKTDAVAAKRTVGARHVLFGNIDPSGVLALGTPDQVRQKTRELISRWEPGGLFILNSGCALPASTPSENIRAFVQTAHEVGVYA
jgi:MtaA/CmuA family methyltransferase